MQTCAARDRKVATTKEWFETRGRHPIYAGNRPIPLKPGHRLPLVAADAPAVPGPEARGAGA